MATQVTNKTVYLALDLANNPEDRAPALKALREFGVGQAPEGYDYGKLADEIAAEKDIIIKHPETGLLTFITPEQFERDFTTA